MCVFFNLHYYKRISSNLLSELNTHVRKVGIFKDDLEDDDDDGINNDIDRVNLQLRKRNNLGMEKLAAATATDDIYDYDGAYDTFKAAEVTSHPLSRVSTDQPVFISISFILCNIDSSHVIII